MKLLVETPEPGKPWRIQHEGRFTTIVVDRDLAGIELTDEHEVIVEAKS